MSILRRLKNFLIAQDASLNALFGGKPTETISGTIGRAVAKGQWWAIHIGEPLVDWVFGRGHCVRQANAEARAAGAAQ